MIRCNMCMTIYEDYDITDCPVCHTDSYMQDMTAYPGDELATHLQAYYAKEGR